MANHSSTKKSIRKTITKTAVNKSRKTRIRTYLKRVFTAVKSGLVEEANNALVEASSEIMKGVTHNLIKKNTAARKISRLNKQIKAISTSSSPLKKKVDLKKSANTTDDNTAKTKIKTVKKSSAITSKKKTEKGDASESSEKRVTSTKTKSTK